jgi:ParB family transcriptional regulator, chromosome partitioning protein
MAIKPRTGTGPGTGTVRPSNEDRAAREAQRRAEATAALRRLATEDVPDTHTVEAIEREPATAIVDATANSGAPVTSTAGAPSAAIGGGPGQLQELPIDAVRLSPFQPKGRPSEEAVREVAEGIARTGGLDTLLEPAGMDVFQRLRPEAKRLAELAYSIHLDGVRDPIEVRRTEEGEAECLSGHRRLAAARLVGRTRVPVLDRGPMTAAQAAKTVLEGNLHRENFTPWQEAVVVTEVYEQRRKEHRAHDVRTIGQLMGWSHGKAGLFLKIRRMLPPAVVARVGQGDAIRADVALAGVESVAALERLAKIEDEDRRVEAAQRLLGFAAERTPAASPAGRTFLFRPKRGGGFLLDVSTPAESLPLEAAEQLLELLGTNMARVQARVAHLRGRDGKT